MAQLPSFRQLQLISVELLEITSSSLGPVSIDRVLSEESSEPQPTSAVKPTAETIARRAAFKARN
ncbi:MAG: hypothetical protein ACKVOS_09600 [Sphingorhabdus sp.]|uniref:hypothetical protein n=1 Tax=Sphingorhabdus sp. TaxID=1902408 RepID=UPI0038FC4D67